jgi:DNA-binding protein HU-beta
MEGLTKAAMIAALTEKSGLGRREVSGVLNALTELAVQEAAEGRTVTIPGIVKLTVVDRPERQVRNPATQEMMTREADRTVRATVSKALKTAALA